MQFSGTLIPLFMAIRILPSAIVHADISRIIGAWPAMGIPAAMGLADKRRLIPPNGVTRIPAPVVLTKWIDNFLLGRPVGARHRFGQGVPNFAEQSRRRHAGNIWRGIGERAGNAALEEVVMAMRTRPDVLPFHTGIDAKLLTRASKLVSAVTSFPVQYNKAIVGRNAFAHESGIHQDGMLKNAFTYEIMTPESVGVAKTSLVMGKHFGSPRLP